MARYVGAFVSNQREKMSNDSTVVTVISKPPKAKGSSREACLVVINGVDLGKKYSLAQHSTLIGRSSKVDIQVDEDSISRNHAVIENQGEDIVVRDLNSTNGTYVNDRPIQQHHLLDGDQVKIGRTIFKFLSGSNIEAAYHDEIYRLTTMDGLTQTHNKRHFLREMERELSRSLRYSRHLSLVMCDIDLFKTINDTYGHLAGDYVLRQFAKRIMDHIRRDDIFARYGGEEFALLLPEVDREQAVQLAEKLRRVIEAEPFFFDNVSIPVTVSMGVADLAEYHHMSGAPIDQLSTFGFIKLTDDRLYKAKNAGVTESSASDRAREGHAVSDSLEGMTLSVVGRFSPRTNREISGILSGRGARVSHALLQSTDYLIAGDQSGYHEQRARTAGVPIVPEALATSSSRG